LGAPPANDTANLLWLTTAEGHYPAVFPDTLHIPPPARRERQTPRPALTDLGT